MKYSYTKIMNINENDINVDETEDSVEGMTNTTPSLAFQKSSFKQPLKKKKDDISNLLQQSIASREQRAKERVLERKKLEDSKTPNDPLYHFFHVNVPHYTKIVTSISIFHKK